MQAMGANGRVIIEFEQTPGTLNSVHNAIELEFIKSNVKAEQTQNTSNVITGRRDPAEPYRGFIDIAGDGEYPLDLRQIGYILKAAFGAPVTTAPGNGESLHTHVYKLKEKMPSFSLEQGFKDINTYAQYTGCKISKLSFSFGGDSELTVTASIMGIKEIITKISFMENAKKVITNKLNFDNALLKEGDENIATATEVSLDIDFSLDGDTHCLGGGGFRSFINDGIVSISGNMKSVFENQALLEKAVKGTKSSLEIPLIKGDQSLTILLPEVKYKRNTPGIDGPKGVFIEMQYDAYFNDNEKDTAIQFTLINDVESYA